MIPILTGIVLWLLVMIMALAKVDLGSNTMGMLLALGAILIASSAVDTVKFSLNGFEFKTKKPDALDFKLPDIDYVSAFCWVFIIVSTPIAIRVDPNNGGLVPFAVLGSFVAFGVICVRAGIKRKRAAAAALAANPPVKQDA